MAREAFINHRFQKKTLLVIEQANDILEDLSAQGYTLTLRQLYYQFVSKGLIPNKVTEYDRLGSIINDARLAGLIDWDMIEDRTRSLRTIASWTDPADIITSAARSYKEDLWIGQDYRPEVWIEKDALVGVAEPACQRLRVPLFACRGYSSQSEQYTAGKRFEQTLSEGLLPVILHLGDHDPSGLDMTRDNRDRLSMFARQGVMVERLALNMDQVRQYNPPPNPAKDTDCRFDKYQEEFGDSSWELDALEPRVIDELITVHIEALISHPKVWKAAKAKEELNKATLFNVSKHWDEVEELVNGKDEDDEPTSPVKGKRKVSAKKRKASR